MDTVLESKSKSVVIGPGRPLVIIGERINPTGRKTLAFEMAAGNYDRVRADAIAQVEAGAHMLGRFAAAAPLCMLSDEMQNRWIKSAKWDLTWLILSVLVVPVAPLLYHLGMTPAGVATVIMLAVGGPHVFVTFTRTNMDPRFVRSHSAYTRLAFMIPLATAAFAWFATPLFLTVFFTWASLHVLQQITYIANCYSNRQDAAPTPLERWAEYGLIFSCLYPFATVRMVDGTFELDGTQLLVPEAILGPGLIWAAFGIFGAFLVAWIVVVARRYVAGTLHFGKYLLQEVQPAGRERDLGGAKLSRPYDLVVFFVDLEPGANWGHACRYLLMDDAGGRRESIPARRPPFLRAVPPSLRLVHRSAAVPGWAVATPAAPEL